MKKHTNTNEASFYGLGIAPQILESLTRLKFTTPTPVQFKTIPLALEGQDVVGIAQTGTGKTLAFGVPLVQRLAQDKGIGLVLVPTRELAIQVHKSITKIAPKVKFALIIGGDSMNKQINQLKKQPDILIATPGRLIDHMESGRLSLKKVSALVLDEADRMLDMGFAPQINKILKKLPSKRQTLLFSATMPKQILSIASSAMKMPVHVEIAKSGTVAEKVTQELFIVKKEHKKKLLLKILQEYTGTVLVFSRTKFGATRIAHFIRQAKHSAAEIHSDRTLSQRKQALEGFRSGKFRVLVATDVAARGIDVSGIELVINYDLPDESENYVHRIGRTGRANDQGHAISFAQPDQRNDVKRIETLMKMAIPISEHPEMPIQQFLKPITIFSSQSGRFRGRSRPRRRR